MQSNMTVRDAESLVQIVRERILALFPDGGETYELIYAARFRRLIAEYARGRPRGVVIALPGAGSEVKQPQLYSSYVLIIRHYRFQRIPADVTQRDVVIPGQPVLTFGWIG